VALAAFSWKRVLLTQKLPTTVINPTNKMIKTLNESKSKTPLFYEVKVFSITKKNGEKNILVIVKYVTIYHELSSLLTFLKAINPMLKITAERKANAIPIRSFKSFIFANGSVNKPMPKTPKKKLIISCLLTYSPIMK